jgi:hypothetical protein
VINKYIYKYIYSIYIGEGGGADGRGTALQAEKVRVWITDSITGILQ